MFYRSRNQSPQDLYSCTSQEWNSVDELLEHALDQELDSDYDYDMDLDLELEFDLDPGEEVLEEEYDDGYDGVDFFPGLMDAASPFGQEINAHTLQSADLDFGGQHLEDAVEQLQNVFLSATINRFLATHIITLGDLRRRNASKDSRYLS